MLAITPLPTKTLMDMVLMSIDGRKEMGRGSHGYMSLDSFPATSARLPFQLNIGILGLVGHMCVCGAQSA